MHTAANVIPFPRTRNPQNQYTPFPAGNEARSHLSVEHIRLRLEALDRELEYLTNEGVRNLGEWARQSASQIVRMEGIRSSLTPVGHVFISYVREDSDYVDRLQRALEKAGIPVWRDTADLWPGEDWQVRIRRAITDDALVFLACFSRKSLAREVSYQNEELALAIDQMRLRRPGVPWLIPVRFDDCDVPALDIGGGRSLASLQRADLFRDCFDDDVARLITAVLRILKRHAGPY